MHLIKLSREKIMEITKKLPEETITEYCARIYNAKETLGYTWDDIAYIINTELGYSFSPDRYRKDSYRLNKILNKEEESPFELSTIKLERAKLNDDRTQINALYRRIAREESLKEIAKIAVKDISSKFRLAPICVNPFEKFKENKNKAAILEISDWHYGIEIENYWNEFNPDIAKQRIEQLRDQVIKYLTEQNICTLHIVNLGDLIAGRIHTPLRINSRFDVITQIIEVSELLAQFIIDLSSFAEIHYYDTLDNHSRLEKDLKESLDLESLTRITNWYLKLRLNPEVLKALEKDYGKIKISIHDNTFGDDIITFKVFNHNVIAVHGHRDKPEKVIDSLSMMTQQHYDLVLTAHLHHFSAEEKNETVLISNSSLMGTDDYAQQLRLSSKPSHNLIIVSKENRVECVYKINLD